MILGVDNEEQLFHYQCVLHPLLLRSIPRLGAEQHALLK